MTDTLLRLSDLRQLGREGGVMLYLHDGTVAKCRPKFATVTKRQRQNGQVINVEEIVSYASVYQAITCVKRNNLIIARKINHEDQSLLRLSGVGFHRREKEKEV